MRAVIAGAILAAGFSRRLGQPKQLLSLGGQPLLVRAAQTALAAGLEPVIAVVRESQWEDLLAALPVRCVVNEQAKEGMASSVRRAVEAVQELEVEGVVLLTCDQPFLTADHLRTLCADPQRVTASSYAGRRGVPAYFPRATFAELLRLHGDAGARELLRTAAAVRDERLALDIDTAEDVQRAEREFLRGTTLEVA